MVTKKSNAKSTTNFKNVKIQTEIKKKIKVSSVPVSHGVGRRKSSVARVWLRNGDGKINVNHRDYKEYFHTDVSLRAVKSPLLEVNAENDFSIDINVYGGGVHSQADAAKLAISRALAEYKDEFHSILRAGTFLTVDSRRKERKKYGQMGARRKFQFVKR